VGATPLVIAGARQDYLTATISHLPYLLACALVSTADATTSADPLVWKIVAGGYRDTSRVAGSDVTMMTDILLTNRDEVLKALDVCVGQMEQLRDLVDAGDEAALREALRYIRETRKEMFP
jgi:prephenate dehydrogenase